MQTRQEFCLNLELIKLTELPRCCLFSNCGIRSEYVVPKSFSDMFSATDIRKSATFKQVPMVQNHVIKYQGRLTGNPAIVDIKVLRVEEVYLNMAEAQYRINGGGLAFLDAVRSRYSGFVSGGETGPALLAAILQERRLELALKWIVSLL
jgi:hypothetical protein